MSDIEKSNYNYKKMEIYKKVLENNKGLAEGYEINNDQNLDKCMFDLVRASIDDLEEEIINDRIYYKTKEKYLEENTSIQDIKNATKEKFQAEVLLKKLVDKNTLLDHLISGVDKIWDLAYYISPKEYAQIKHLQEQKDNILILLDAIEKFILVKIKQICANRFWVPTVSHIYKYTSVIGFEYEQYIEKEVEHLEDYIAKEIENLGKYKKEYSIIIDFLEDVNRILRDEDRKRNKPINGKYECDLQDNYDEIYKELFKIENQHSSKVTIYDETKECPWKTRRRNYIIDTAKVFDLIYLHRTVKYLKQDYFFINQKKICGVGVRWDKTDDIKDIDKIYDNYKYCEEYQKSLNLQELEEWQLLWMNYIENLKSKYDEIEEHYDERHIDLKIFEELIVIIKDQRLLIRLKEIENRFLHYGVINKKELDKLKDDITRYYKHMEQNPDREGEAQEIQGLLESIFKCDYESTINYHLLDEMMRSEKRHIYDTELYCVMKLMKNLLKQKEE